MVPAAQGQRHHTALVRLLGELGAVATERRDHAMALRSLLAAACRYLGWPLGHAYSVDAEKRHLRPTMVWYESEPGRYAELLEITERTESARGEGLLERAVANRRHEWVEDLAREDDTRRTKAAVASGLRTAVAVPVLANGSVHTVLEFFANGIRSPDEEILAVLDYIGVVLRGLLEAERLEEENLAASVAARNEWRLHGSAVAHVRDAIVVSTVGTMGGGPTILYVNAAFTRMTGYTESEVLGKSFDVLAGEKTSREALRVVQQSFRRGQAASTELIAYRKDGSEFLLKWHASPIPDPDGTVRHYASIQRDITDERRVEQALRRADRDSLTGLPTRDVLENHLQLAITRAKERSDHRFALLFLDLDGFKAVNDEFGHVVGDQLLTSAARRLEGTIRPGDALARFGGDEFVILLERVTDLSSVTMVADRIQDRMSTPFEIQGNALPVAVSIGIALSRAGYERPEEVIRDADAAMYEAKRKGRGRVAFFDRNLRELLGSAHSFR